MDLISFKCDQCSTAYQNKAPDKCRVCGGTRFSELSPEQIGLRITISLSVIIAFIGFIGYQTYLKDESQEQVAKPSVREQKTSSRTEVGNYEGYVGLNLLREDSELILQASLLEYQPNELIRSVNHACKVIKARYRKTINPLGKTERLYKKVESVCDTSF